MNEFAKHLLTWYSRHGRKLPWRNHPDPYAVWVSEIMLQQTQVATAIPYFKRWLERFPTILTVAQASEVEILSAWEGLGYYARARNLHKASKQVVKEYGGSIPADFHQLMDLPGIGRYTAAAIASMAFGQDVAALDGNVKRVFSRLFKILTPVNTPAGERKLWGLASRYLPQGRSGDYNQALMDLGATICLPKNPICSKCPMKRICVANQTGMQDRLPKKLKKAVSPRIVKVAAVILKNGKVLLFRRPSRGLLGGMWEFPSAQVDADSAQSLAPAIKSAYGLTVSPRSPLGTVRHVYSHFKLTEHAFLCTLKSGKILPENFQWVSVEDISACPMGKVDRRIANELISKHG